MKQLFTILSLLLILSFNSAYAQKIISHTTTLGTQIILLNLLSTQMELNFTPFGFREESRMSLVQNW